jgi:hypothetical protein
MKKLSFIISILCLTVSIGCGSEKKEAKNSESSSKEENLDSSEPVETETSNQDWIDVQSKVSRMNSETTYDQIIDSLGKSYEEYATPSLPEEYVMFYNVPGVNGAIFWVMLNTKSKTFIYWSGEKNEK